MDQENQTANSINLTATDPVYAPIDGPEPAAPTTAPVTQPTSVSDQINAFGHAQQAAAGLDMSPISTQAPASSAPQFAQPLPPQPIETTPMVPPTTPAAPFAPIASAQPLPEPINTSPAPVAESFASIPQMPDEPVTSNITAVEPPASAPTTAAPAAEPTAGAPAKTSFKSLLLLIGIFVLLFGLALLIGYSLGFKAGQTSMPGM